jgi:hypothetical protein
MHRFGTIIESGKSSLYGKAKSRRKVLIWISPPLQKKSCRPRPLQGLQPRPALPPSGKASSDKALGHGLETGGALIRGGNWNNGTNSGLFTMNLNNDPTNANTNIGFRCVFRPSRLNDLTVSEIYGSWTWITEKLRQ